MYSRLHAAATSSICSPVMSSYSSVSSSISSVAWGMSLNRPRSIEIKASVGREDVDAPDAAESPDVLLERDAAHVGTLAADPGVKAAVAGPGVAAVVRVGSAKGLAVGLAAAATSWILRASGSTSRLEILSASGVTGTQEAGGLRLAESGVGAAVDVAAGCPSPVRVSMRAAADWRALSLSVTTGTLSS